VGNAFVHQYYNILHQSPELVFRFYQDASRLGRPAKPAADMDVVTTMEVKRLPPSFLLSTAPTSRPCGGSDLGLRELDVQTKINNLEREGV
jgi:hypothetical protein